MEREPGARAPVGLRTLRSLDPRAEVWDAGALAERSCPFCAVDGRALLVRPDGLRVHRCERCGTYYVSPAPDTAAVEAFYQRYHDRHRVDAWRGTAWHAKSRLPTYRESAALAAHVRSGRPLDDLRLQELASVLELHGARVLDVGCGTGTTLWKLARLGADAHGVDVDRAAVDFVKGSLGIASVRLGTLDDLSGEQRFDAVVLQDILEHVRDPRAMLERSVELLRRDGILSLWTPNATWVEREEEPLLFRIDYEHLQFLQARTIVHLAAELGLELLHLESLGYLSLQEDAPARAKLTVKAALARLPGFKSLNRLRLALQGRHQPRAGNYHLFALLRKR